MIPIRQYDHLDKMSLIEEIQKLKEENATLVEENETLMKEKNQFELLELPWIGNLGNWHWNVETNKIIANDQKFLTLNYTKEEVPEELTFQFFTDKLHPDHYEMVMENMGQHLNGETKAFEVEYKIQTKEGDWVWYYDRGVVTERGENGEAKKMSGIVFDITEEKKRTLLIEHQNELLWEQVYTDYLTGSKNRKAIFEELEYFINQSNTSQAMLGLILFDLDDFKLINDTYGHLTGDQVLRDVVQTILPLLKQSDSIGRYGGEEFMIILPDQDKSTALALAEQIKHHVNHIQVDECYPVTISSGLAMYNGEDIDQFVDYADRAMYYAKTNGKNRIIDSATLNLKPSDNQKPSICS